MTTERFSKEDFEQTLDDILASKGNDLKVIPLGLASGEYEYHIPLPPNQAVSLAIRSSVDGSGFAAETGTNSIRVWLVDPRNDEPVGSKVQAWVTRVSGWRERLAKTMRELVKRRMETGDCHRCYAPISIYKVKKNTTNQGRLFGKCTDCGWWWGWLDSPDKKIYFKKGENNGKTDTTGNGDKNIDQLRISPSLPAPSAGSRQDSVDGLPEERDGEDGQEGERGGGRADLPDLSGTDEGGGGLSFLAKDSPPTLAVEEEPVTSLYLEDNDKPSQLLPSDYPPTLEQQAAITAPLDKPVRVLAGPGSGKTFLLTHRYKHLVENGVDSQNILAVTFTKEMANVLGERILAICPEAERGIDQICTIHAICYRILKAEGDTRRVPKWWKIKKAVDEITDDVWPVRLERPGHKDVLGYINSAKGKGLKVGEDRAFYSRIAGTKLGNLVSEIRKRFDGEMRAQGHLTFSDMLLDIEIKLREDDAFRHRWQSKFHHVIIDEGQDISGQAMRILATLAEPQNRLTIVGDSDQLLYRFAGATPEVNLFDGFEKRYPDGDLYKLTVNWRSTREIVDKQLELIRHNYESQGGPYEDRYIKELQPKPGAVDGEAVSFQWYETPEGEALGVADGILEDMNNGYKAPDFFIASRTRAQTAYIEGALVRAGVPYVNLCGGSFWTLKHVQDVVGYIRLAYDQGDDKAFQRVFNIASSNMVYPWGDKKGSYCSHRYLGRAFLDASGGSYGDIHNAVRRRRSFGPGVDDLVWFTNDLQAVIATESVADLVGFILDNCYIDHLAAEEGVNARDDAEDGKLTDLATVKDIARSFGRDVKEFLGYVNEMIEAAERARQKDWSEHVVVSTVHRLKGLERKVVYGIGWCEGEDRLGFPVGLLPHTFSLRPPPQNGVLPVGGQGRIEDERCIAFVCISRAMEKVRLSGFESHMMRTYRPSRFVEEALSVT